MLQISSLGGAPVLNAVPDATWGLHLVDANIALGNAVNLLRRQAKAYGKAGPGEMAQIVKPRPECRHCGAVLRASP